jgi:hypothetical protein
MGADVSGLLDEHRGALATRAEMMGWVTEVVDFGVRRPGTAAGHRVEAWVADRFRELGLRDVRAEPVDVPVWEPGEARVVAWPEGRAGDAVTVPGFPLPFTRPTAGTEADLVPMASAGGSDGADALRGAIGLESLQLGRLPGAFTATLATGRCDPDGELDAHEHLLPFGPRLGKEVDVAVEAGAAGYVGVMDVPWDTRDYYVPYDGVDRALPAVWVDRVGGEVLRGVLASAAAGGGDPVPVPVRARLEVDAGHRPGRTANVVGSLPGASDEWVVIGSHHDAPWASAVEDGTGIALVLAQARFWAGVPAERRPHNLLFLLNGGHMVDGTGVRSFLAGRGGWLDRVVLSVHLEHAAAACEARDGRLVATGDPEVRWWFASREPGIERSVSEALAAEGVGRSWILPPEAFGEHPPTDGGPFHSYGVPLVDFLSAPAYLFDACDTLDKVHEASLEPINRAAARIVAGTAGRTAAETRALAPPAGGG